MHIFMVISFYIEMLKISFLTAYLNLKILYWNIFCVLFINQFLLFHPQWPYCAYNENYWNFHESRALPFENFLNYLFKFWFSCPSVYCFIKTTEPQLDKFVRYHSSVMKVKSFILYFIANYFWAIYRHFLNLLKKIMPKLGFDLSEAAKFASKLIFILLCFTWN